MNKRISKKVYFYLGLILIIIISLAFYLNMHKDTSECNADICSATELADYNSNKVVAEYNSGKIYMNDLNKAYDFAFFLQGVPKDDSLIPKGAILNQTIIENLLYNEAIKEGYSVNRDSLEQQFQASITNQGQTLDSFKNIFENQTFDYDYLIDYFVKSTAINELLNETITSKISVNDSEIKNYYNSNKEQFNTPMQIKASHILVNTSLEAQEIISELNDGTNFGELAKNKSIGPSAKDEGNLNWFSKGQMVKEFEDAAFALKNIGDYTKVPVKTQYGYHIIKLTGRKESEQKTFDEVKDQIKDQLMQQKNIQVINAYITNMMSQANVKIYLNK